MPEARLLVISPYDKSSVAILKKQFMQNLGVNPTSDGEVIRITVPLTEERRKELVKTLRKLVKMRKYLSVTSVVILMIN